MTDVPVQGDWSAWSAPAKLNLFLHITGRRPDGYHNLQTVFQLLDWGDTVHCRVRGDAAIRRLGEHSDVTEQDDLVVRAAHLLKSATGSPGGADLRVDKRIPVGGGMGGGSSDAAATLVALNQLWRCGLSLPALARLGREIGADVPVFIYGRSAFAEGVGDELVPVELPERSYVILDPAAGVSTAALFQAPELTRDSTPLTIAGYLSGSKTENVFEPVVRTRYAAVARALDWLSRFGDARLTGTGGVVFLATDASEAKMIAEACPSAMSAWVARGINVSPLLAQHCDGSG